MNSQRHSVVRKPNSLDLVSRQAAIDVLRTCYDTETISMDNGDEYINYGDAVGGIDQLPSAEPERETAKFIRWMECKETAKYISYTPHCKCSKCGTEFIINTIKYCYVCGAKMEEVDE